MSAARPLSPGTRALPDHCHAAGRVTANNEWPDLEYGVSLNEIVTRVTPPKVAGFLLVCSPTVRASHGIMFRLLDSQVSVMLFYFEIIIGKTFFGKNSFLLKL